ncbi:MAG: YbaK/EbsC family protein [archaeon]|nr:YbaK/EbsC family protein [archaeon]
MDDCKIVYWVPHDLPRTYSAKLLLDKLNYYNISKRKRSELIEYIPENHEILKEILSSEYNFNFYKEAKCRQPAFVFVDKGKRTNSIKDAAKHLGLKKKSVSKTIVAREKNSSEKIYLLTVLGDRRIKMDDGIFIEDTGRKTPPLVMIEENLVDDYTGMSLGSCGPFPLNNEYSDKINHILFDGGKLPDSDTGGKKRTGRYSIGSDLVNIGIGPKKSILMSPQEVYSVLKELYPEKVSFFYDD